MTVIKQIYSDPTRNIPGGSADDTQGLSNIHHSLEGVTPDGAYVQLRFHYTFVDTNLGNARRIPASQSVDGRSVIVVQPVAETRAGSTPYAMTVADFNYAIRQAQADSGRSSSERQSLAQVSQEINRAVWNLKVQGLKKTGHQVVRWLRSVSSSVLKREQKLPLDLCIRAMTRDNWESVPFGKDGKINNFLRTKPGVFTNAEIAQLNRALGNIEIYNFGHFEPRVLESGSRKGCNFLAYDRKIERYGNEATEALIAVIGSQILSMAKKWHGDAKVEAAIQTAFRPNPSSAPELTGKHRRI